MSAPADKPIAFTTAMVHALVADRKHQTRRICKDKQRPPFRAGEVLYVKEAIMRTERNGVGVAQYVSDERLVRVGGQVLPWRWKPKSLPSMYCPKEASRIRLRVTALRHEPVQDISEADAKAEGVTLRPVEGRVNGEKGKLYPFSYRQAFMWLWDSINTKRGYTWESNPRVWVVTFDVAKLGNARKVRG